MSPLLTLGTAGWCYYLSKNEGIVDKMASELVEKAQRAVAEESSVFVKELEPIFPEVLRQNELFLALFDKALSTIQAKDPAAAIASFFKEYY